MARPKGGYLLKDGVTKVPGTTTICGAYKDSGGLLDWAWKQGMQGLDYKETRDKAGEIGTVVHEMIEASIKGADPHDVYKICSQLSVDKGPYAWKGYNAFLRWKEDNKIEILEQEVTLVHEGDRYGGTLDAVGTADGKHVLLDWKTSKGIYKNYLLQMAAYTNLWNFNFPERPITGGAWLVRFSKTDGACEPYFFSIGDLLVPLVQFLLFRQAYGQERELDMILERSKSCMKPL